MLPPLAPFPPADIQRTLLPDEWKACLEGWILLAHGNLLLSSKDLSLNVLKEPFLTDFLVSYMRESSFSDGDVAGSDTKAKLLKRECFLLTQRILADVKPIPSKLLEPTFLSHLSILYQRSEQLKRLIDSLWDQENLDQRVLWQESKTSLVHVLGKTKQEASQDFDKILLQTGALLKISYHYGQFLMLGSDIIDTLSTAFQQSPPDTQKKIMALGYFSLLSLLEPKRPRFSTLLDHLYSFQAGAGQFSLLTSLCALTPFLHRLENQDFGSESERAKPLIASLVRFKKRGNGKSEKVVSNGSKKGKGKDLSHDVHDDMHVHKLSLITQIQDIFPDLGSGFIIKLLEEYADDTEQVIAHLLENSLPGHLKQADQTEELTRPSKTQEPLLDAQPSGLGHSVLSSRRNIYDDDAFDRLAVPTFAISHGRSNVSQTADEMLSLGSSATAKAAILSALATFDSDSDERDDTYDAEDVGGTVDSASPSASDDPNADLQSKNDETLFNMFKRSPEAFIRDAASRRGGARAALKRETGMTDEAIEGWAIMLSRDPRHLHRLEAKYSIFGGAQRELPATAYRASALEDSDSNENSKGGRGGGSGTRHGQRRKVGNVAGSADDSGTQVARQRKDEQKASRANHNRRNQHARKMARGGGMAG